jgi:hypothetical protein
MLLHIPVVTLPILTTIVLALWGLSIGRRHFDGDFVRPVRGWTLFILGTSSVWLIYSAVHYFKIM